jgi:hypothetical protein
MKKKNKEFKELTYNLGSYIREETLESIGIEKDLLKKILPFLRAYK